MVPASLALAVLIAAGVWLLLRRASNNEPAEPADGPRAEAEPEGAPPPAAEPETPAPADPDPVPRELLEVLAERFKAGGPAPDRENGWRGPETPHRVVEEFPKTAKLTHAHTGGADVHTVAVDGSVRGESGTVSFAAVATDGRAIVGVLDTRVPRASSMYAELQGARIGLRLVPPGGTARIALDNMDAVTRLRETFGQRRPNPLFSGIKDASLAGDLRAMGAERTVKVKAYANGGEQTHTNPLMAYAHNLAFAAGYLAERGADPIGDEACRVFLLELLEAGVTRNRVTLRRRCLRFTETRRSEVSRDPA